MEVQDAHEPAGCQVLEGNPAEGVLEKVRDADDPEAARGHVQQGLQRFLRPVAFCEDDQVRPLSLDDLREVGDAPEHWEGSIRVVPGVVVDDAQHRERSVRRMLGGLGDVSRPAARSDHEHAPFRRHLPSRDRFPHRQQAEDRHCHQRERRGLEIHPGQRDPEGEGRDDDQAGQGAYGGGDGGPQRERDGAERAPDRDEPDRSDERGGGEGGRGRGSVCRGEEKDRDRDGDRSTEFGDPSRVDPVDESRNRRRDRPTAGADREP